MEKRPAGKGSYYLPGWQTLKVYAGDLFDELDTEIGKDYLFTGGKLTPFKLMFTDEKPWGNPQGFSHKICYLRRLLPFSQTASPIAEVIPSDTGKDSHNPSIPHSLP